MEERHRRRSGFRLYGRATRRDDRPPSKGASFLKGKCSSKGYGFGNDEIFPEGYSPGWRRVSGRPRKKATGVAVGEIGVEISAADLEFEVDTEAPGSRLSDGDDAQSYLQVMKAKLSTRVSVTIVRVIANSFTAALGAFFTTGPAVLFGASFATVFEFIS